MDGTSLKTIAVFLIIFGCFVILFPKLFYPLILTILNLRTTENVHHHKADMDGLPRPIYEAMKKHDKNSKLSPAFPRMGAHPGMHAASEMKKMMANNKQSVEGRGTLGYVLPLYAIGIVVYLVYTLSKLFAKKQNKSKLSSLRSSRHYVDYDSMDEAEMKEKVINKQKELEQLLWKADQELIGDDEMNALKERLKETENQMSRILRAMEAIQHTVASQSLDENISNISEAYMPDEADSIDQPSYSNEDTNEEIEIPDSRLDSTNDDYQLDDFDVDKLNTDNTEIEDSKPSVRKRISTANAF